MLDKTGVSGATWSDYERGKTEPKIETLISISELFRVGISDLLKVDLSENVHLIKKEGSSETTENVHPIVHPTVHPKAKKDYETPELKITIAAESGEDYAKNSMVIPITDISVAAGAGTYNQEYITNVESLRLPIQFLKRNSTYLCVKIKGISMAPTFQDGGYVVIRLLDRSEWAKMPDERVYVVSDNEGKSYLKRVKNRFKQNFIVLKSDSPDQATFPSFNLATEEINTIWYCEWYFSAKMPNVHDQFYSRLQRLEDKVDDLLGSGRK